MLRKLSILFIAVVFLIFAYEGAYAEPSKVDEEQNLVTAAHEMKETGRIQLNFKDLEIAKFIRFMSELLGENILVDPSVKGTVSVVSPKPISIRESREVMLSVLEMNNLAIESMGSYSKIHPLSKGPSVNNSVIKGDANVHPSEAVTIQVIPLDYVKAGYVLAPLKAALPAVNAAALGDGSSVQLVGKASMLNRAGSIIRALDVSDSIRSIKIYSLAYANATSLAKQMNAMSKDASSKLAGILAVPDDRTKRIIIVGSSSALRESQRILKGLDVPSRTENFHIYRLQNADAKTVAEQLSQILAVAAKLSAGKDNKSMPSTVVPDLPTNSLIFTANQEQFDSLREILQQLDTQPKQVLIRGLVAEVNLNKLNSAGFDWAAWGGALEGNAVIAGNIQLGTTGVPGDVLQLYKALVTKEEVIKDDKGNAVTTTNVEDKGLAYAYIKMLNKYDAINVLSMPRLMCTDNLPGSMQVGQVIPQMKASLSDTANPGAISNTFEYKDVGLILNVTPHVRSGNLVALEIEQRIEELMTTQGSTTPVTSKREIKTSVLVANGETIILGGLIKEAEKILKNRVPLISYIPLVGNLFQSKEKQREKIDLMIFLTPYILENPKEASRISNKIVTEGQKLSEGELKLLERNHIDYQKSIKQEGITKEMLNPHSIREQAEKKYQEDAASQTGPVEVKDE